MTKPPTFSLEGISVFIGMPARGAIPVPTVRSLLNSTSWMDQNDIPSFTSMVGGGTICSARCQIAKAFLEGNCNRLVFIDSDMVWETEDFIRLLALSSKLDIVAGAYQGRFDPPHFYMRSPDDVKSPDMLETNEYGCIKMAGIGLGFTVVSRAVIEKLVKKAPTIKFREDDVLPEVFRNDKDENGNFRGEDMNFFDDARKIGFDLWVEPKITLGHIGDKIYKASILDKRVMPAPELQIAS
jgi:hypothetical protein